MVRNYSHLLESTLIFLFSEITFRKILLTCDLKTGISCQLMTLLNLSDLNLQRPSERVHTVSTVFWLDLKETNQDCTGSIILVLWLRRVRRLRDTRRCWLHRLWIHFRQRTWLKKRDWRLYSIVSIQWETVSWSVKLHSRLRLLGRKELKLLGKQWNLREHFDLYVHNQYSIIYF